jgi:integrase
MTYNIELADKPGKTGLYHVMIRLHAKGHKPARIQFSHEIELKHWNTKKPFGKWVRSSFITANTLNENIEKSYNEVKGKVEEWIKTEPHLSPKDCKIRFELGGSQTPFKALSKKALHRTGVSSVTNTNSSHVLDAFLSWAGEGFTLERINHTLLISYRKHLMSEGLMNSTINTYMSKLKVIYDEVQSNLGLSDAERAASNPFTGISKLRAKSGMKGRLREKGLETFKSAPYTFYRKAKDRRTKAKQLPNWPDWARWVWLASFYQGGMRIGDLLRSRYEWYELDTEGYPVRLRYQMQKSKGRWISLKLNSEAISHLKLIWQTGQPGEAYLLPFLDKKADYARFRTYEQIRAMPQELADKLQQDIASRTSQLNRALKSYVKESELPVTGGKLTNHSARHSVGDAVVRAMKAGKNVSLFDFQALFGHSSIRTTEIYRGELDEESLDAAVDSVYGI